jgi:hypothetical protein
LGTTTTYRSIILVISGTQGNASIVHLIIEKFEIPVTPVLGDFSLSRTFTCRSIIKVFIYNFIRFGENKACRPVLLFCYIPELFTERNGQSHSV